MRKYVMLFIVAVSLFVTSCKVEPSEVSDEYAKKFVEKVKYVRSKKTGLCFAIVATKKTDEASQNGISWTWVPAESIPENLILEVE